jgi:hypothetical protein
MTISASDIMAVTKAVTKKWSKQRRAEDRGRSRFTRVHIYSDRVNFSAIASQILPGGYAHASGGRYTVDKRQFYYACREAFRERTGREITADYFSQTLLVKYMNQHPEQTKDWKITASPRGTLTIPNAGHDLRVPCGTIAIEEHLAEAASECEPFDISAQVSIEWPALTEGQRYQAVLYIEKEGFDPQLKEAKIAEKYDLAIISCKGQSVVAARRYVDHVCRVDGGVPLLIVHDFDPSGFSICQRLTSNSRWAEANDLVKYQFQNEVNAHDLGLRLEDVEKYNLQSEHFHFRGLPADLEASAEERAFFRSGRRVELNAFTAPQFIEWIEAGLQKYLGKRKFIPADEVLEAAYRRALAVAKVNEVLAETVDQAIEMASAAKLPKTLRAQLAKSKIPWDKALYELAKSKLSQESNK